MLDFRNMNEIQRRAVMHGEGPLLLVAGPGSGKTYTITNRILYLLKHHVHPEKILVITFTKEAALSMQRRFAEMLSGSSYPVNFGTFHSFFYHILRESNVLKDNVILKNSEKKNIILPILAKYNDFHDDYFSMQEDATNLLSAFGYYKNTLDLTESVKKAPSQWQMHFEEIYKKYQHKITELGRADFDDLLLECLKLFRRNKAVLNDWRNRFEHILIDEFQDINPIQYEIIKLLAKRPYNIFAVGDDDQSIYGFRGSKPDCLRCFSEEFHAERLFMNINYRSVPEIVKASLDVINENKNRYPKNLIAAGESARESFLLQGFVTKEEEYQYLLKRLRQTHTLGENCAVLFRTNQFMQSVAIRLRQANIPYEMREKAKSIYEHFIVQDIIAYLQLARGKGNRLQLLQIMNKPLRYIRREAVAVRNGSVDFSGIAEYYDKQNYISPGEKYSTKDKLQQFEKQLTTISGMSLMPAITYILKAVGYEDYLRTQAWKKPEQWAEWEEMIEWIKADAAMYDNIDMWLAFQKNYSEEISAKTVKRTEKKGNESVQLLTVHGAKGLEFDHVFIPDCNERVFPHGRMPDENVLEEERRIFYVGMTRAKKSLELMYLTGTKERPRQPSAFLNPLYSSSTNSSNSQLSKYSSNASATRSYSSSSAI